MIPGFWSFHSILTEGQSPSLLVLNSDKGILHEKFHPLNLPVAIYVLLLIQVFSIIKNSSEIAGK